LFLDKNIAWFDVYPDTKIAWFGRFGAIRFERFEVWRREVWRGDYDPPYRGVL
jgi:hypothetical protein